MYKPAQVALAVLSGRKTNNNILIRELYLLGFKDEDGYPSEDDLKEKAENILYGWIDDMYDEIDQLKSGK